LLGIGLAAWGVGCQQGSDAERPNVILISIDSLRADHLSCYGYDQPTSPQIDRLAIEGARFRTAVSSTSWTLPSHAAMFTSLRDSAHGLVDNGLRLGEVHHTLAETLQASGYQTAGFYGGPYLHPTFGLDQGFEVYVNCMTELGEELSEDWIRLQARTELGASHADITGPRLKEHVQYWRGGMDDRPYFLFLHMWDVHYDYIPPQEYVEMFDPDYTGSLSGHRFGANEDIHPQMDPRDLQHLVALYDGEIRFTDDILRDILEGLRQQGLLDNTLVVVTADHGEEFFEHGGKGHQRTLFDEVLLVPLIFHWPGVIARSQTIEDQVGIVDIMPTILGLLGIEAKGPMQGRDLTPLLRGESLPQAAVLTELLVGRKEFRALRTRSGKIISEARRNYAYFDLDRDAQERQPQQGGEDFQQAFQDLRRYVEEAGSLNQTFGGQSVEPRSIDPEMFELLQSLGYLEEAPAQPPEDLRNDRGQE
jgi:arylsulfatase A-like enzyme